MLRALAGRVPVPEVLAVCEDPAVIGAPFYVMRADRRRRAERDARAGARRPRARDGRGDDRRAGGAARGRLARRRAGGLRPARRLPGAPAGPLRRAVGAQPHARAARDGAGGRLAGGAPPGVAAGDDRPRRLPPRQPHVRAGAPAAAWSRCSTGRCRRSATRSPTSATCARSGSSATTRPPASSSSTRSRAGHGWPAREELVARYEERSGRSAGDIAWYRVLALWKVIVFMEGNYRRALAGSVDDPYLTRSARPSPASPSAPRR